MAAYVDKLRNWGWKLGPSCHLIADSLEELHVIAAKIGLKREWYQPSSSGPHYDLTKSRRDLAIKAGAIPLDDRPFHDILRAWLDSAIAAVVAAPTEEEKAQIRHKLYYGD